MPTSSQPGTMEENRSNRKLSHVPSATDVDGWLLQAESWPEGLNQLPSWAPAQTTGTSWTGTPGGTAQLEGGGGRRSHSTSSAILFLPGAGYCTKQHLDAVG